jgi:hypothetical protein
VGLCRRFIGAGVAINDTVDRFQSTPLIYAAWGGSPETIALLVEQGADVTVKNSNGITALDLAKRSGVPAEVIARLTP